MYSSYSFWTSALYGGEWLASRPGRAYPRGKDNQYPLTGDWVGTRATGKILCLFRGSNLDCTVVQHVVRHYCLSYTAHGTAVTAYGAKRWNCTQGKSQECSCHIVNSMWWWFGNLQENCNSFGKPRLIASELRLCIALFGFHSIDGRSIQMSTAVVSLVSVRGL
jgi:hypothetical protein